MTTNAVVLAAGQGTRMCSTIPKVLHPILGRPLAWYAVQAARQATGTDPLLVIGYQAQEVRQVMGDSLRYVTQEPQLGTGHAVMQARSLLEGTCDTVLVTYADMPLLRVETLSMLVKAHESASTPISMLTLIGNDPRGFGRVLRDPGGNVQAIVEEEVATPQQLAIKELNTGVYCFAAAWLWEALEKVPLSPKGEYYLTDLVGIAVREGLPVKAFTAAEEIETIGINTRVHLAEAEIAMRQRINQDWMLAGVTMIDPSTTYIEPDVTLGRDTVIWPNTYLHGNTSIGENCVLGPNTILRDSKLGNRCEVLSSVLEGALVEDDVNIGPFAHLRKGAHLGQGVHMGNFGEIKNSYLGPGTKMGHFSYIGDTTTGSGVNIGAGTVTCNYDGVKKNPTWLGDNVFIGSDTMLVAPVRVGDRAHTGAGAVVTKDVPADTLAVGVPARAIRKLEKHD
jgi:bifunctional UDP-N-acetylglucosamine pyrophosphorylase/glucosamine-1-phosphate N-acetyltransferase